MLQIYQKKLKFTVDVRSLPSCTIDGKPVRLMALSGPRAWTDREPFALEDAVHYATQFEMKEVNSLWPNFFVGINGGNWMVLDGVLRSESQVDAPVVRYGRTGAATPSLTAWCTGGEGAPVHPNSFRPELLVIFASAGVLSFDGVLRVFNVTSDDSYDPDGIISVVSPTVVKANIRTLGDVYASSLEQHVRVAGEIVGQLAIKRTLDQESEVFSGLIRTGAGAMMATSSGDVVTWGSIRATWTIAPYYDGGVVHLSASSFLEVTVPGSAGGGAAPDLNPVVDAVDGVAQAIAGGGTTGTPHIVLAVGINIDQGAADGTIDGTRGSLGDDDPGEESETDNWDGSYEGSMFHNVPDAPVCVYWSVSDQEDTFGVAVVSLGSSVDMIHVGADILRLSVDREQTHGESILKVRIDSVEP